MHVKVNYKLFTTCLSDLNSMHWEAILLFYFCLLNIIYELQLMSSGILKLLIF